MPPDDAPEDAPEDAPGGAAEEAEQQVGGQKGRSTESRAIEPGVIELAGMAPYGL